MNKIEPSNLHGVKVAPLGIASWIERPNRELVAAILTSLANMQIRVLTNGGDGSAKMSGSDAEIVMTPAGTIITLDLSQIIGSGSGGGRASKDFKLVSDGGDYYNCNTFDGVNTGSAIVKVAKHQDLRCILPSATPAGGAWASKTKRTVLYNYTYVAVAGATADGVNIIEYTRSVSVPSDTSLNTTSYIDPCLNVGDIITAFPASFQGPATLIGVQWQAVADGRAWSDPA